MNSKILMPFLKLNLYSQEYQEANKKLKTSKWYKLLYECNCELAHGMNNEFANKGQNAWRILIEVAIKVVNPKYSKKYALAHEMSLKTPRK